MSNKISLQEGLDRLLEHYNELGRIPKRQDFIDNKWSPDQNWYAKYFKDINGKGSYLQACFELGLCEEPKEKIKLEINEELQELINIVVKENPNIKYKECCHCGRKLPIHSMFFSKNKMYSDGINGKCRECNNVKSSFSFKKELNKVKSIPWYDGKEEEFKKLYRVMSWEELMVYYNVTKNEIKNMVRRLKITRDNITDYTKDEVIFMYETIASGNKTDFPDGFYNVYIYKVYLIKYLINDILKWDRNELCEKWNFQIIDNYNMSAIRFNADSYNVLCTAFPEYNLKRWELRNSGMPHGFWNDGNIKEATKWLLLKLKKDKGITNIYEAIQYGFGYIVDEYNLDGLRQAMNKKHFEFFEFIFQETLLKISNYKFNFQNIVYVLKEEYYNLKDNKKKCIDEIIKFCEIEGYFPIIYELSNINGYLSYGLIKNEFKEYSEIFKYIKPIGRVRNNYWKYKENRVYEIKDYCENICKKSILTVINNSKLLRKWVEQYYIASDRINEITYSIGKTKWASSSEYLFEAYPQIKENHILFDWEFFNYKIKDEQDKKRILKELILFRMNNVVKDLKTDIPKYLNMSYMKTIYPKFNAHISKKNINSYYEWACDTFPEYCDAWCKQDFGMIISKDDCIFDSYEECRIYEYLKFDLNFKYIRNTGKLRNGEYTFDLDLDNEFKRFCPDFYIEYIDKNNEQYKLNKPIVIEYYGWYYPNNQGKMFKKYVRKTKIKDKFYKSRDDIYYIGIFPEDIKINNMQGVREKLTSFFMLNFNIDIKEFKKVG